MKPVEYYLDHVEKEYKKVMIILNGSHMQCEPMRRVAIWDVVKLHAWSFMNVRATIDI